MTMTRIAVGTLTTALLLAGGGVAAADETQPPATQEPITLTVEQSVHLCTERIPALLARIDRLQARIDSGAATPGSTAWLRTRAEQARAAGRDGAAERLDRRVAHRPELTRRLADAQQRVATFRDGHCA